MPAVSRVQQRFFGYLKANPEEAAQRGISAKVAGEFAHAPGGSTKGLPVRARQRGARDDTTDPDLALAQAGANIYQGGLGSPQAWGGLVKGLRPMPQWGTSALPPDQQTQPGARGGGRGGRMRGMHPMHPMLIIRIAAHPLRKHKQAGARGGTDGYSFGMLTL